MKKTVVTYKLKLLFLSGCMFGLFFGLDAQSKYPSDTSDGSATQATFKGGPVFPTPFNCGSPCTNPGFESGSSFWDYSRGTACASPGYDPCNIIPGFSNPQQSLQTLGTNDPVVGAALPVVPPGGGNNTMRIGDGPVSGGNASRASISFMVSAASANFTYKYALVLQDPVTLHTDEERPYFNIKIFDQNGNVIPCGNYQVLAKAPMPGFTKVPGTTDVYYKPWTSAFIPLSAYIGQCVTIQFTVSDCGKGTMLHYGYAYIDASCDPLQVLSSSTVLCAGGTVTMSAPSGGIAYSWTNTAGGTTGIVGSGNGINCVVNQAGTYQVVITSPGGASCTTTLTITIGTNPVNPVSLFTNTTVCVGTATQFTDTSTPSGSIDSWAWDFNNDGITDDTTQHPSHIYPSAGTYTVSLITGSGPCSSTVTQTVTVNPLVVPVISQAGPFCINAAPFILTASPVGGTWSGTGITNTSTGMFDPGLAGNGNFTISYVPSGACPGQGQTTITIFPQTVLNISNPPAVCTPAVVDITAAAITNGSIGLGNLSYYTNAGATNVLASPNAITLSGTYYIVSTLVGGCADTTPVVVVINPTPVVDFSVDRHEGCPVHCVKFNDSSFVSGGSNIAHWNWSFGDGAVSITQNPTHCYSKPGYYDVSLTVSSNHGCTATFINTAMIHVFNKPLAEFGPSPNPVVINDPGVVFTNLSSADVVSWTYLFGDGDSCSPSIPSPSHLYPHIAPVTYQASLIVQNANGCKDTIVHPVTVEPEFIFYIPNAFTPNGDGKNDTFYGLGLGIVKYEFWIFDRWGNMIFQSEDLNDAWNGKVQGSDEKAQIDVYVWKVKLMDVFKKTHHYVGTVSLIR